MASRPSPTAPAAAPPGTGGPGGVPLHPFLGLCILVTSLEATEPFFFVVFSSFSPGKDTDLGSALPAGRVRAAGGTEICSTATIGTRIISQSGTESTSDIATGIERGTGTTETGEVVAGELQVSPPRGFGCPPHCSALPTGVLTV